MEANAVDPALLPAMVDSVPTAIFVCDAAGSIQLFNPGCERLFGYAPDEVIGKSFQMLMYEPFRDDGKIVGGSREVTGQRKDGSSFPMDLSVGGSRHEGDWHYCGIARDLTDYRRRAVQQAEIQKLIFASQVAGGVAHEFNNILTVVLGNADRLVHDLKARPDLQQLSASIVSVGERGAVLTQQLLSFGRQQTLHPVALDCNRHVGMMQEQLRKAVGAGIDIRLSLDPSLNMAFVDPSELDSALLNLALNARDAMPDGGCLTISTANTVLDEAFRGNDQAVMPGDYVLVSVADDGKGMSREVRERAFEPFFTTKDVGKGSGLGLSMVFGFAKQSGGHVSLLSEVDGGTTVRLYLPSAGIPGSQAAGPPKRLKPPAPTRVVSVLAVEHDPFVLSYAVGCLEKLGYRVDAASNDAEALARLAQGAALDILFVEVVASSALDGGELVARARQITPGLKLLLTSDDPQKLLAPGSSLPAGTPVLGKPYRIAELARHMRLALSEAT